ncbi:hypothetical protein AB0C12_38160 [Actinoplanes sp. NPDC048967]|uniref:hypothetical protein n=1 Tax=Actinoplanes sp. NPDC048967 TaxID=3155269 RepID=UPI003405DE65
MTDIVTFGPGEPPRRPSRRLLVAGAVALAALAAGTVAIVLDHRRAPDPPAAADPAPPTAGPSCPPPTPAVAVVPVAMIVGCARGGTSLDRRDPTAGRGPWTVVVRRIDGSLGRHGAVVTFPVAAPPAGAGPVKVGGKAGKAGPDSVTWPAGGAWARIRGDLPEPALVTIAARTGFTGGRPVIEEPPAGYVVAGGGPYRPPAIHEIRYGSAALGEQAALGGGLAYTGVVRGGGFEDQLYAAHATAAGPVGDHPAVVSPVFGGNGSLAWEPAPGVVAYVGYSGSSLTDGAVAALLRLAQRSRPVDDRQWRATSPQAVDQSNEPG